MRLGLEEVFVLRLGLELGSGRVRVGPRVRVIGRYSVGSGSDVDEPNRFRMRIRIRVRVRVKV